MNLCVDKQSNQKHHCYVCYISMPSVTKDKRNVYARVGFDVFYFLNYVSCYHELCELGNLVPWYQEHECVPENEVTVKYSLSLKTSPVLG
jgi:hypothetical protein